jgi:hypothetical protein
VESDLTFVGRGADFTSAMVAAGLGGVTFSSCTARRAFSTICCCLFSSLAKIGTRSFGTGVLSLKFRENFFRSFSLTAFDSRAIDRCRSDIRNFSAAENCLKESRRSCSTFAVALLGLPCFWVGIAAVGLKELLGFCTWSVAGLLGAAGLASVLGAVSLGASGLEDAGVSGLGAASVFAVSGSTGFSAGGLAVRDAFAAVEPGRASCADIMAGSTGGPSALAWPLGGRRDGGTYVFGCPLVRGRYTPLYLFGY